MARKSSASSRREPQHRASRDATSAPRWVRTEYDILNPPPLTDAQREELRLLAEKSDDEIDLSDIPELGDDFFRNAERGRMYRALKRQLTIRLDADVLDWFKRHAEGGKGWQTDINRVLRAHVEAEERKREKASG